MSNAYPPTICFMLVGIWLIGLVLLLWPLGFGQETEPTARWWLERPLWLIVPGIILAGLVALFGRFETQGHRRGS